MCKEKQYRERNVRLHSGFGDGGETERREERRAREKEKKKDEEKLTPSIENWSLGNRRGTVRRRDYRCTSPRRCMGGGVAASSAK